MPKYKIPFLVFLSEEIKLLFSICGKLIGFAYFSKQNYSGDVFFELKL